MKLKILPILFILPILSGCMTYSESFDCPPGRGVGCKSLSQVNDMVEKGDLPLENINSTKETIHQKSLGSKPSEGWIEAKNSPLNLKIWVANYKDEDGNFHSPSYVYASLNSSPQRKGPIGANLKETNPHEENSIKENS